jgi:hypothetical protein
MTEDAANLDQLRAQFSALAAELERSTNTICFLIGVCSACVEAIIQSAEVVADTRPDIAAQAAKITETWQQFLAGANMARAAAELQNAPSSDAPQ